MTATFDTKEQKQKLTLGLSKDVIEKAKEAGINISAVTEELLKAITFQPEGNTVDNVVGAYEALFRVMSSKLIRYESEVEVGTIKRYEQKNHINLNPWGGIMEFDDNEVVAANIPIVQVLHNFYEPRQILHNFISAMIKGAEENKERIEELRFALRFVKLLSTEEEEQKND
jgi:hypothetical protein